MTHPWHTPPTTFEIPQNWNLTEDDREEMTNQTWSMILQGIDLAAEYAEYFEDELETAGVSEQDAEEYFESVIAARKVQQEELGGPPSSALTQAFEELATIGVLGRENFTCCGTCGSSEIWDERDDSRQWRGYLYYHSQDAEWIPESRETYVGYGAFVDAFRTEADWDALSDDQKDEQYTQIVTDLMVNEVFPVLAKHGVEVDWNKDLGTRIKLSNVDSFISV